jgi:cyclopropane fatty-acyl-phospholipid synthase-like methyltransferase
MVLRRRKAAVYLPYAGEGRLLDFGCGSGENVARMAAAGWKAEGIDLSAEAVAAGRAAGLPLRVGTLPGMDLPRESFDTVTAWGSLEHVPSPLATLTRHLEAAGLRGERFIPVRSGGYVRESFRYLADDTGRRVHRALSRSRFMVGLLTYWALAARRTSLMVVLARRA